MNTLHAFPRPQVLDFDVFCTLLDRHSGIARAVQVLQPGVNGGELALTERVGVPWHRILSAERVQGLQARPRRHLARDRLSRSGWTAGPLKRPS